MRAVASLILASVGAYAFSLVTDLLVGAMLRDYPSAVFHALSIWSVVAVIAFLTALAARGPAWTVWLPCVILAGIATRGAFRASTSHSWAVSTLLIGQAFICWWAMRPTSPRAQPSEPE